MSLLPRSQTLLATSIEISDRDRYECVDGKLISMNQSTRKHDKVVKFLSQRFTQEIQPIHRNWVVCDGKIQLQTTEHRLRIPDICILTSEQNQNLKITEPILNNSIPVLVVEVIGKGTRTQDTKAKRKEYQNLQIPEYWMVDFRPSSASVCILSLVEERYQLKKFHHNQMIISPTFPNLALNVEQVLDV